MKYSKILLLLFVLEAGHSAVAAGNAEQGASKASVCSGCHGPTGISVNPSWPNLAGQQEAYLAKQIRAFRDGIRQDPNMQPFMINLTDQDADDLAAHYAAMQACP